MADNPDDRQKPDAPEQQSDKAEPTARQTADAIRTSTADPITERFNEDFKKITGSILKGSSEALKEFGNLFLDKKSGDSGSHSSDQDKAKQEKQQTGKDNLDKSDHKEDGKAAQEKSAPGKLNDQAKELFNQVLDKSPIAVTDAKVNALILSGDSSHKPNDAIKRDWQEGVQGKKEEFQNAVGTHFDALAKSATSLLPPEQRNNPEAVARAVGSHIGKILKKPRHEKSGRP